MNVFKTLLEKVTPDIISEEQANEMLKDFNDQMDQVKIDAKVEGETAGFEKGYEEGKKIAKAEAQAEFDRVVDQLDVEATEKLTEIVRMLDEDAEAKLQEVYGLLKAKEEELLAQHQQDMEAMDSDHAEKMEEIVEAMDVKHAKMLTECKNKIDAQHAKLLKECVQKLKSQQHKKIRIINENVEKYLTYALQQHIPDSTIIHEEKYNVAMKTLNKINDLLSFNNLVQESKPDVFGQYQKEIDEQRNQINKLISENVDLKTENNKKEAQLVLEQKIHNLTPATQEFVRSQLSEETNPKVICEKVEDAVKVFRKQQAERRQELVKGLKTNKPSTIVVEDKVSKPGEEKGKGKTVITESSKPVVEAKSKSAVDAMDFYVNCLTKKK